MLDDTELANPFVLVNEGVSDGVSGEVPFVIIALVGFINDPNAVCKQDTKILECAASRRNQRFITCWQLHSNAQRDQLEFSTVNVYIFGSAKVDPIKVFLSNYDISRISTPM